MYTRVKTAKELKALRESCKMASQILDTLFTAIEPGVSGIDVNEMTKKELRGLGVKAAFLGYQGFPATICISRNDEVVHGIPNSKEFKVGDLVGLDFGVNYKGMISDTARTVIVGDNNRAVVSSKQKAVGDDQSGLTEKRKLLAGTKEALVAAIKTLKDGVQTGDIGAAAQSVMERYNLGIVRDMVGHGVGHEIHEEPNIANFGKPGTGDRLKAGMTIAIEPMATLGTHRVVVDPDGWTIRTADASLSAHFEHTILITKDGFEILTQSN